jgi:hypothetical protein
VATKTQDQIANETIFEWLSTPGMQKEALDAVTDYTRDRLREDGFADTILPPVQISNDQLTRQMHTDKPCRIVDKEPDSPAAISVPFGTTPTDVYIRGPRYPVFFDRVMTPRFTKDVDELRTYEMDIRQILSDNSIKDMLAERDSKFISAVNSCLIAPNAILPWSERAQWEIINGGITRETLLDAMKVMPRTRSRLEVNTILCNNITIKEIQKFGRDEMGGDFSQDVLKEGWSSADFLKAKWVITIKHELVPDDTLFFFGDPKFLGKSYNLEDTVMYIERKFFLMEFFAYSSSGATIANTSALARVDFE